MFYNSEVEVAQDWLWERILWCKLSAGRVHGSMCATYESYPPFLFTSACQVPQQMKVCSLFFCHDANKKCVII